MFLPGHSDSENKTTLDMNPISITFIPAFNYQKAFDAQNMHPPTFSHSVTIQWLFNSAISASWHGTK